MAAYSRLANSSDDAETQGDKELSTDHSSKASGTNLLDADPFASSRSSSPFPTINSEYERPKSRKERRHSSRAQTLIPTPGRQTPQRPGTPHPSKSTRSSSSASTHNESIRSSLRPSSSASRSVPSGPDSSKPRPSTSSEVEEPELVISLAAPTEVTALKAELTCLRDNAKADEGEIELLQRALERERHKAKCAGGRDKQQADRVLALENFIGEQEAEIEYVRMNAQRLAHSQFSERERDHQAQADALQHLLRDETTQKIEAQQALGELRSFFSLTDEGDTSRVIQAVKDVNEAVDDLAFNLFEVFLGLPTASTFDINTLATAALLHPLLKHVVWMNKDDSAENYILAVFKMLILDEVSGALDAFHPALGPEENHVLSLVWKRLTISGELPGSVARWRSMTYRAVEDHAAATPMASESKLLASFTTFFLHVGVDFAEQTECVEALAFLFREVAVVHRLIRAEYVSTEFGIFNVEREWFRL
ncbi:hypothetical protein RQP46_001192 [Phenoliferia psychrophenolica]